MRQLSQDTEQRLLNVIDDAVHYVSGGMSPNDALEKAARAAKLPQSAISVAVHAYNVGRTAQQRAEGADAMSKVASFELADAEVISRRLFPDFQKNSAGEVVYDGPSSADYETGPSFWLQERDRHRKLAAAVNFTAPEQVRQPLPAFDPDRVTERHYTVERLQKAAEEARRQLSVAEDAMRSGFCSLSAYFKEFGAAPYAGVKQAAAVLHGGAGRVMFELLDATFPEMAQWPACKKAGKAADVDSTQAPFPQIAEVLADTARFNMAKAAFQAACEELYAAKQAAAGPLLPVGHSLLSAAFPQEKQAMPDPLQLLGTYSLLQKTVGDSAKKLSPPDDEARVTSLMNKLNDPEHESRLRAINSQAMLHNLMANDEVISGYDPAEVANAYSDIVQISPSVGDQQMLMQSLLRQRLAQGSLDPFEQDRLLGYEDSLRKQTTPMGGVKA